MVREPQLSGSMDEVLRIRQFPLAIEFDDGSGMRRYLIRDPPAFYHDPSYPRMLGPQGPDAYFSRMGAMLEKYGAELSGEEFEAGDSWFAERHDSNNPRRFCIQYRFQPAEGKPADE